MPKLVVVYQAHQVTQRRWPMQSLKAQYQETLMHMLQTFMKQKIEDIKSADAIAIGSSTFHYKMLPPMEKFLDSLDKANAKGKIGAAFGSYGWSGEAPVMIAQKMRDIGIKVIDPVLRVQYAPSEKDLDECKRLGKDLANKIKKA